MDTLKVFIENLPKNPWYKEWIPIIIALLAIIVSIYSLNKSSKEYSRSSRPFVWAINFAVLDSNNRIVPQPRQIAFRVKNSPAKIHKLDFKIFSISDNNKEKIIFSDKLEDMVRFPDEKSQWTYDIAMDKFDGIISSYSNDHIYRQINLEYSLLGGKKIFNYELKQRFNEMAN